MSGQGGWHKRVGDRIGQAKRPRRDRAVCQHCLQLRRLEGRRLCASCRKRPEVRALYPSKRPWRASPDFHGTTPAPPDLLPGNPGSTERLQALAARVQAGQGLFGPGERGPDEGGPGRPRVYHLACAPCGLAAAVDRHDRRG